MKIIKKCKKIKERRDCRNNEKNNNDGIKENQ